MTVCSYCGKLIWRKYWEARDVSGRFCSMDCAYHASCKKSLEKSLEQHWLDLKMSEPPIKKDGIYSCLEEASSSEKKDGIDVSRGTDCRFGEMSNITGKNIRWSFNKNKVSVYYDSIVNNSAWQTGADEIDSPDRFEGSIRTAPNAEIVLAHVKNPEIMTAMLNRYPHVNADLSCTPPETVTLMCRRFPKERLLFGTDFPASLVFTDAADSLPDIPDEKQLSRLYADWHKKT